MTQVAITGRISGVDRSGGPRSVSFACLGIDRSEIDLSATEPNENVVEVRLRIGNSSLWRTIENAEVSVGAAETRGTLTSYAEVGRAPVLTSIGGAGTTEFTFRVLPGYIDPAPNPRQLEISFNLIAELVAV
ncbi:MAG: hypothetical protein AAFZ65_00765 [Planctomycetota bacterium]